jgi:hypothetical protein
MPARRERKMQVGPYRLPVGPRLPAERAGAGDDVDSLVARAKRHYRGVAASPKKVVDVDEDVRITRPSPRPAPRGLLARRGLDGEDYDVD